MPETCGICAGIFKNCRGLKTHMSRMHGGSKQVPELPKKKETVVDPKPKVQKKEETVIDLFEKMNLNESEEKEMVGYLARAKMADRVFSSIGNFNVIPDENNKKLLITEKIENEKNEHIYVCHKCKDSATIDNMMEINIDEMKEKECIHAKLSEILFGNAKSKKKPVKESINAIDVLKDKKETIALVVPAKMHNKAPGIIFLSSRTKRPKCETCSGQKCIHVNIYMEESKKEHETESMRERSKEKNKNTNMENTKVISEDKLPVDKKEAIKESKNETDPFSFKGKESNVFGIAINYPPKECEKMKLKEFILKISSLKI